MSLYRIGNRIAQGIKNLVIDEEESLIRERDKLEREARIGRLRASVASLKAAKRATTEAATE